MITMEILGKIRRLYLRDKLSLHEIAKRTRVCNAQLRAFSRVWMVSQYLDSVPSVPQSTFKLSAGFRRTQYPDIVSL